MNGDEAAELEEEAINAALSAGALRVCPIHPDVMLRELDPEADRDAYRIAMGRLKANEIRSFTREDLQAAVHRALAQGGALSCWKCDSY
jgi:hypothetical protein